MVKIAKSIETRVRGSVYKTVVCENCQCEFVYQLTRYALGAVSGSRFADTQSLQEQATRAANANLRGILERAADPVPCLNCGNYQKSMIPLLRAQQYFWMFFVGVFFLVMAAILSILCAFAFLAKSPDKNASAQSYGEGALWMGGIGFFFLLVRKILSWRIHPNDGDPEVRKQIARQLAMTKTAFELLNKQTHPENPITEFHTPWEFPN